MIRINITSLVLLILFFSSFLFGVNEFRKAEKCRKVVAEMQNEFELRESEMLTDYMERKLILKDSINQLKVEYKKSMAVVANVSLKIKRIESDFKAVELKVEQLPFDSSYLFLMRLNKPLDSPEFPFSGNQVKEMHRTYLEGEKSKEVIKELEVARKYLNESLILSGDMNYKMKEQLVSCESVMEETVKSTQALKKRSDKLKKKVKRNRLLSGVVGIVLIAVLI